MKPKNKKCIECGREDLPHFSKKRCVYCARRSYTSVKAPKIVSKKEYGTYYTELIEVSKKAPYSYESGVLISNVTKFNICHLFPKRSFKSVANNTDNFVLLTREEHTRFDHLLDLHRFGDLQKEFPKSFQKLVDFYKKYESILEDKRLKLQLALFIGES